MAVYSPEAAREEGEHLLLYLLLLMDLHSHGILLLSDLSKEYSFAPCAGEPVQPASTPAGVSMCLRSELGCSELQL